ncbi:MAG: UDP-N-acetylmuramate dehydrogenase [Endomicrobia bacterium]|nr:UDP-N-acetylmuramate dehydrogenase [Endomicrobiia bacterium]MCL2507206.1 UDP-N-acetylmuramate dehydrogenase [Endomicrobiia bacterium]
MTNEIIKKLSSEGCIILKDESLSKHSSFKIGGSADFFINIPNEHALFAFLDENLDFFVLGGGTNLLFSDKGYKGIVIRLVDEFEKFSIIGNAVSCGSGAHMAAVIKAAVQNNLSGFESCAGIPGTIGGAVFGNAGSKDCWISDIVESVEVFKKNSNNTYEKQLLKQDEILFDYRTSALENCIITKINFTLKNELEKDILKEISESIEKRKNSQPLNLPNAGCIFKNPVGFSAGKLIEDAGLKGKKKGDAEISQIHANFIVNNGNATASNVLDLIYIARKTVKDKFNIDLELEIKIV